MIGPSSSHTAGAARIGRVARSLFRKQPTKVTVSLYGSFAKTYKGHGTDVAIIGGILDFDTFDQRIPHSLEIAKREGMEVTFIPEDAVSDHPNTTRITLSDEQDTLEIVGVSIGGGKIEITELNGFVLKLSGMHPAILVVHNDKYGTIAAVTAILMKYRINIGHMEVARKDVGKSALMVIEVDHNIDDSVMEEIQSLPNIVQVTRMIE